MNLDRKLNLVVPVDRADGVKVWVHATPISRAVFETYFLTISKTFAAIYNQGLGAMAGPRIAGLMLKKVATEDGVWEGAGGVEGGLLAEIRRLATLVCPADSAGGWQQIPFQEAVDRKLLDEGDVSEVENILVFFIVASAMHRRADLPDVLGIASSLWSAQTTSSNSTEFTGSLQTSTETASIGEKAIQSSIPH